jgi:orotidine-5'-phosphate decarboxylase
MSVHCFSDRLLESIERKRSHVVVGFDPDYELVPQAVRDGHPRGAYATDEAMKAACCREFLLGIMEAVHSDAVAIKIQCAYFEALGREGYGLYLDLVRPIQDEGCLVIADAKRGDIGSTAEAYARAHLDVAGADAMTVNPYLGTDSMEPFVRRAREEGKGVFVLVKTSNPGSADIQDLWLTEGRPLREHVADLVRSWGAGTEGEKGYLSVGAVVGGTHPREGAALRAQLANLPLLVPGYGAQGAQAADLTDMFDERGSGTIVNSSRGILYAYRKHPGMHWLDACRREVADMKAALWKAAGRG